MSHSKHIFRFKTYVTLLVPYILGRRTQTCTLMGSNSPVQLANNISAQSESMLPTPLATSTRIVSRPSGPSGTSHENASAFVKILTHIRLESYADLTTNVLLL